MKRIMSFLLVAVFLTACGGNEQCLDRAMALRSKLQRSEVTFDTELTADYGDKIYTFSMTCQADATGNLKFTVTQPESIAGISGKISKDSGKLTFDDKVLGFDVLADGLISPVCGPWVFLETLRSGYLTSCTQEGEGLRISIDDSYQEKALHLDIWLDMEDIPQRCEVIWQGRRLLSMTVKNFTIV